MPSTSRLDPAACQRISHSLALGSALGLVLLCLGWELLWAPTGSGSLAIKALPLALTLPGLFRARLYTYRVLSLMVWLYFTEGVVRAYGDRGISAALAGVEIALSLLLFVACIGHVLCLGRARKAVAT
jgi:uncharacterized membrane protein